MPIGKIHALWRYPVKSLVGESLDSCAINSRGLLGDRLYAIANADGKLGSGKNTKRFKRIDGLLSMSAKTSDNGVTIVFADGTELSTEVSEQGVCFNTSINTKLSQMLGQSVSLIKEAGDLSHFDDAAIHIITTSSLASLNEKLPTHADARRFRANMLISTDLDDDALVGKVLNVGAVSLEIIQKTKRCSMIAAEQIGLQKRREILTVVAKDFGVNFGLYAKVLSTGLVSVTDSVEMSN